jgi:hypothetical protein
MKASDMSDETLIGFLRCNSDICNSFASIAPAMENRG